jgi:hypothetical protein
MKINFISKIIRTVILFIFYRIFPQIRLKPVRNKTHHLLIYLKSCKTITFVIRGKELVKHVLTFTVDNIVIRVPFCVSGESVSASSSVSHNKSPSLPSVALEMRHFLKDFITFTFSHDFRNAALFEGFYHFHFFSWFYHEITQHIKWRSTHSSTFRVGNFTTPYPGIPLFTHVI